MSESTQTKLLSSVPTISSLAEGDKITVVTAAGQTALVSLSNLQSIMRAGMSAGRNLAKDSAYIEATPTRSRVLQTTDNLRPGDVITICADEIVVTGPSADIHKSVYVDFESLESKWVAMIALPIAKPCTLTLPAKSFDYDKVQVRILSRLPQKPEDYSDTVKIYGLSVVRGAVAPLRWSPAPEDIWGGVIPSFSEANKASARISKKGGLHEYIDNADKGSHQCNPEGYTLGCAGNERICGRHRHGKNSRNILCGRWSREQTDWWLLHSDSGHSGRLADATVRVLVWHLLRTVQSDKRRHDQVAPPKLHGNLITSGKEVAA